MSVCLSRTICVCTGEKWFRTFVRGTVRTENEIVIIVSVCVSLSSTICVYRTAKWFNPFVRGTFERIETETSLLTFELNRSTILKKVWTQPFYTFPILGPLGDRPSSLGVDRNRSTLSNVASPRCTAIKCRNQFSVLSVPHHAAQPQALNSVSGHSIRVD